MFCLLIVLGNGTHTDLILMFHTYTSWLTTASFPQLLHNFTNLSTQNLLKIPNEYFAATILWESARTIQNDSEIWVFCFQALGIHSFFGFICHWLPLSRHVFLLISHPYFARILIGLWNWPQLLSSHNVFWEWGDALPTWCPAVISLPKRRLSPPWNCAWHSDCFGGPQVWLPQL